MKLIPCPCSRTPQPHDTVSSGREREQLLQCRNCLSHKPIVAGQKYPNVRDAALADSGLISYRYKGRYGFVMIGAVDDNDALREAGRSLTSEKPSMSKLEKWDGKKYVTVTVTVTSRKKNPTAKSGGLLDRHAQDLLATFKKHGMPGVREQSVLIFKQEKLTTGEFAVLSSKFEEMKKADYDAGMAEAVARDLRKKNPVPLSKNAQLKKASKIYEDFTGYDASRKIKIDKPEFPDVLSVIGDIDEIFYTTDRDGGIEKYRHKFEKNCRPLFCVSPDGEQIFMIGGSFKFTERGIVDAPKKR